RERDDRRVVANVRELGLWQAEAPGIERLRGVGAVQRVAAPRLRVEPIHTFAGFDVPRRHFKCQRLRGGCRRYLRTNASRWRVALGARLSRRVAARGGYAARGHERDEQVTSVRLQREGNLLMRQAGG